MHADVFDDYYQEWLPRIRNLARRIARGDADFADDLAQEALWKLAELDLEQIRENAQGYIWSLLRNQMLMVRRRERRAQLIAPPTSKRSRRLRRGPKSRPCDWDRGRHHVETGPQHDDAAPIDDDWDDEMWDSSS